MIDDYRLSVLTAYNSAKIILVTKFLEADFAPMIVYYPKRRLLMNRDLIDSIRRCSISAAPRPTLTLQVVLNQYSSCIHTSKPHSRVPTSNYPTKQT